jgi:outer membrane protein OmpA-like peptidoglycan-associated protein
MKLVIQIVFMIVLILINYTIAQNDIDQSKDHQLISRYPGSHILYYDQQDYTKYSIATGPVTGYKTISEWMDIEGKFTRIYYELENNTTITQIFTNYQNAMDKAGFEILAKGLFKDRNVKKEVGGGSWLGTFYEKNSHPTNSAILLGAGSSTSGGTCFIAGKLIKGGAVSYVIIAGKEYSDKKKIYMIDIIEETKMEDDLIVINADEMLKGIRADGKIALYGIYFDTDKADLKPESSSTLQEIASLIKKDPKLNLYIVGHTDMTGNLDHNIDLSKRRAVAVVKELTTKYGINSRRLTSDGVGPLAPVATNETENGRKLNRRVELVAK